MKPQTKQTILIVLVSIAVSFAIYGRGIRAQFTYDDGPGIQTRLDLKDPRNIFLFCLQLPVLTYYLLSFHY